MSVYSSSVLVFGVGTWKGSKNGRDGKWGGMDVHGRSEHQLWKRGTKTPKA